MPIEVIDKIKQKNGKTFKLIDAADVEMANGESVEEAFGGISISTPVFDLVSMGLGAITVDGEPSTLETDTSEIMAALEKGAAAFVVLIDDGENMSNLTAVMNPIKSTEGEYMCSSFLPGSIITIAVMDGMIFAMAAESAFGGGNAVPTSVDLSGYESGTVVETYSDGSTNTYTFEFDADGNPTKITDGSGNETVLTW